MMKFRSLFLVVAIAFFASAVFAQSNDFASPDNSFTIALPNDSARIRVVNPYPSVKGGNEFSWRIPQGQYLIGYIDLTLAPKNAKQRLEKSANDIVQGTIKEGGELISKKEISYNNYPGLEIKFLLTKEVVSITRFYLIGNRMYNLSTGWLAKGDGEVQLKVLDSFKLLAPKAKSNRKAR